MNNKRLFIFVAIAALALAAFAFVGSPYTQLDFAQAFQDVYPPDGDTTYNNTGGSGGRACELAEDDPRIGDAAVAPVDALPGLRFLIGACPAYTAPNGSIYSAGNLVPGDQHPINGFSTDGEWTRITIGCQSLWVQTSCGQVISAAAGLGF